MIRELASLVVTPFILWFSLPRCADQIVEFFRETSIYVDGLGYVCKYAMFDINEVVTDQADYNKTKTTSQSKDNQVKRFNSRERVDEELSDSNDSENEENDVAINKMMQSYMYFMDDYENSDKVVGKNQFPHKRYNENSKIAPVLNNTYSWKKQFRPGQKPELFRIGKHSLETREPAGEDGTSKGVAKTRHNGNRRRSEDLNMDLGESFIGSIPVEQYELPTSSKMGQKSNGGGGVFRLVKEFYNQSDIGR